MWITCKSLQYVFNHFIISCHYDNDLIPTRIILVKNQRQVLFQVLPLIVHCEHDRYSSCLAMVFIITYTYRIFITPQTAMMGALIIICRPMATII